MEQKAQEYAEETNEQIESTLASALNGSKTCTNCDHVRVCDAFKNTSIALSRAYTDKTRPFNPEDLGRICTYWTPRLTRE